MGEQMAVLGNDGSYPQFSLYNVVLLRHRYHNIPYHRPSRGW